MPMMPGRAPVAKPRVALLPCHRIRNVCRPSQRELGIVVRGYGYLQYISGILVNLNITIWLPQLRR